MTNWNLIKKDTFKLKVEGLDAFIGKIEPSYGWFVSCPKLGIYNHYVDTDDFEKAESEGSKVIVNAIEDLEKIKYILSPSRLNYELLWNQLKDLMNDKNLPSSIKTLEIMKNMERKDK